MNIVAVYVAAALGTLALGLASKWIDRKVTARVQWRMGPPWFQPLADVLKLMGKETLVPETASRVVFLGAPLAGLAGAILAATILWHGNGFLSGQGFVGDVIAVWYLSTLPALALVIGGTAAGTSISALGASREMKMVMSYELPLALALAVALTKTAAATVGSATGTAAMLGIARIVEVQSVQGSFVLSISGAIALVVGIMCTQAKLGLVPFDAAEAETEIIAGPYTEYSGPALAVLLLTRATMTALMPIFLITLLWGGFSWQGLGPLWAGLKYVGILVVMVLMRNTNPRLRIDQAMKFFWYAMTPLAALAVVLAVYGL